jgi:hypothetical protein
MHAHARHVSGACVENACVRVAQSNCWRMYVRVRLWCVHICGACICVRGAYHMLHHCSTWRALIHLSFWKRHSSADCLPFPAGLCSPSVALLRYLPLWDVAERHGAGGHSSGAGRGGAGRGGMMGTRDVLERRPIRTVVSFLGANRCVVKALTQSTY